ncbi:DUF4328 domain-containing protein [Streptomyces capoamus]|uniref:DUF4328 domain-containing protein n=1 Tax=Streptomyces capoamus TaxID=68183 RepID=UPI003393FADD
MTTPMPAPMPAPPHAVPPGGAWLRSPAALGRATVVLLGLVIATDLFACYADWLEMDVTGDLRGTLGTDVLDRAHHADRLYGAAGIAQGVALVATAAVYLCWLWRIRVNAEVFDASRHRMKRGWTIGAWFCPVVNLWFPRRIVADSWDASAPWGSRSGHTPVNAWWTLWLVGIVVGRFADTSNRHAETADELKEAARAMLFSDALDIAAAVLAIVVVLQLTRMQERKVLSGELPAPALG